MKKIIYILSLLLSLSVFSCKNSDLEYSNQFEDSFDKFIKFKKESNNSYQYQTSIATTDHTSTTTISVINGKVIKREHLIQRFDNHIIMPTTGWTDANIAAIEANIPEPLKTYLKDKSITLKEYLNWSESQNELGKYNGLGATPVMTLDEVYTKAKGQWLVTQEKKKIFFETKNNGMISSCGYVIGNCQDDCFTGINISLIKPLNN